MMILKKTAAVMLCAAVAAAAAGCKSDGAESVPDSASDSHSSVSQSGGDIKLKSYEFPEFLSSFGKADVLSNPVYESFDPAKLMVEPETQPFDGYKCTAVFADNYYIFKDGENYGLMDPYGTVLLEAEGIEKISAAAVNVLKVKYSDGTTGYFLADGANVEPMEIGEFDSARISFAKHAAQDGGQDTYTLMLDGAEIYDAQWSSYTQTDISELDTEKKYEAVYRVTSGGRAYYITFDRFYNYTVYEAEYGFISLKIGGEYGECYIVNSDDYSELETLISSFGRESRASAPSKDENADYIQITLGLADGNKRVMTVSADGYCFTEKYSDGEQTGNKYFAVMSKETFVDLVNWVDSALGAEYGE